MGRCLTTVITSYSIHYTKLYDERAIALLTDLYEPFLPSGSSVIVMDEKSASYNFV